MKNLDTALVCVCTVLAPVLFYGFTGKSTSTPAPADNFCVALFVDDIPAPPPGLEPGTAKLTVDGS
jgi:hypothetical protein